MSPLLVDLFATARPGDDMIAESGATRLASALIGQARSIGIVGLRLPGGTT